MKIPDTEDEREPVGAWDTDEEPSCPLLDEGGSIENFDEDYDWSSDGE